MATAYQLNSLIFAVFNAAYISTRRHVTICELDSDAFWFNLNLDLDVFNSSFSLNGTQTLFRDDLVRIGWSRFYELVKIVWSRFFT